MKFIFDNGNNISNTVDSCILISSHTEKENNIVNNYVVGINKYLFGTSVPDAVQFGHYSTKRGVGQLFHRGNLIIFVMILKKHGLPGIVICLLINYLVYYKLVYYLFDSCSDFPVEIVVGV